MQNVKVAIFALAIIGFFATFANSIPQIESRPPQEVALSLNMSPQQLAAAGRQIVEAKGGCLTCHGLGAPGPRAPDLQGIGARSATRKPGQTSEQYLRESLIDPCTYIVEGYQCIMTPFNRPPIALNDAELAAVIAFLQSLGGEITVKPVAPPPAGSSSAVTNARTPQEILKEMACFGCHTLSSVDFMTGKVAPDLSQIGTVAATRKPGMSAKDYIRESLLDPNAFIAPDCPDGPCKSPSAMPAIFGDRLTAKQMDTLVEFLSALK